LQTVMGEPLCRGAADELHLPVAESVHFGPPLTLERCRTDHQHLLDFRLASQQLGRADGLDGFSQTHVVSQDGAARARGERNAVQLIGQQRDLEQ
jgi:hypothetical protein